MQGSDGVRDLIHQLLRPSPAERMTMEELFNHPWFQQDLADGALELNDMLLQAVGADYADANNLQVLPFPPPLPTSPIPICVHLKKTHILLLTILYMSCCSYNFLVFLRNTHMMIGGIRL